MNKWILAALVTVAVLHDAPLVSAQAPTREGYILPMMYDSQGAQHFYHNGYYGDLMPPMAPQNKASSVRQGRLSPLDARAHANPTGSQVWRHRALHQMAQAGDHKHRQERRTTAGAH